MADYSMTSPPETCPLHFNRMAGQLRVALPGIIRSFDPASQTVTAQPALKMKVNLGDGEIKQMDYPVIQNVPVVLPFAQGAGLLLTLPVKPGDECLLVFADRAMDFFTQSGGIQPTDTSASEDTTTPRAHHLTDAICIPGLISNPQAVPDYNGEHIEIRDRERKQYFSLGPDGITITDGTAIWNMKGGKVTLNAPTGISYTTPANMDVRSRNMDLGDDNRILGNLRSVFGTVTDMGGVVLNTHTHNKGSQPDKTGSAAGAANPPR